MELAGFGVQVGTLLIEVARLGAAGAFKKGCGGLGTAVHYLTMSGSAVQQHKYIRICEYTDIPI